MDLLLRFREYRKEKHFEKKETRDNLIPSVNISDSKPKQETESPKEIASLYDQNLHVKPVITAKFTEDKATSNLVTGQINRFHLEVWLNANRPDLLAAIRAAEEEVSRMYWYAEAGYPEKLRAAEAALARAVEAGQRAMWEALAEEAGREEAGQDPGRELEFAEVERLFGGFSKVWNLTDSQAARLEAVFAAKGPVVVRSENGRWWSAEEWQN